MSESLRDWFTKSKSSDGKPGWVQLGGKYAGKSCAKQPGQTTKPKCGSSQMAASMSDKEEDAAARRKRAKDPNPNRSGAPINVATKVNEDACKEKVKARYNIWPSAYASGALVKCRKVGAANWGNKTKKEEREVLSFKSFIAERCWDGYKPNPNKKAYDKLEKRQRVKEKPPHQQAHCVYRLIPLPLTSKTLATLHRANCSTPARQQTTNISGSVSGQRIHLLNRNITICVFWTTNIYMLPVKSTRTKLCSTTGRNFVQFGRV
jgi:hypothetical protein